MCVCVNSRKQLFPGCPGALPRPEADLSPDQRATSPQTSTQRWHSLATLRKATDEALPLVREPKCFSVTVDIVDGGLCGWKCFQLDSLIAPALKETTWFMKKRPEAPQPSAHWLSRGSATLTVRLIGRWQRHKQGWSAEWRAVQLNCH